MTIDEPKCDALAEGEGEVCQPDARETSERIKERIEESKSLLRVDAEKYGVSIILISEVKRRKRWTHVE